MAAADPRTLPSQAQDTQDPRVSSATAKDANGACEASSSSPGVTAAVQPAESQGLTSTVDPQVLHALKAQQQLLLEAAQQQQSQSLTCQESPASSMSDLAALFAASGLQPQLCLPDSPYACSDEAQDLEGLLGHTALLSTTTAAAAAGGQISASSLACLWAPASESAPDAAAEGSSATCNGSRNSAADAAGSSSQAATAAAAAAAAALFPGMTISRFSSSSSAAMTCTAAGAGIEAAATCSLLLELNVNEDTLMSLLTGGRDDECEQPVWMVINLQVRVLLRR